VRAHRPELPKAAAPDDGAGVGIQDDDALGTSTRGHFPKTDQKLATLVRIFALLALWGGLMRHLCAYRPNGVHVTITGVLERHAMHALPRQGWARQILHDNVDLHRQVHWTPAGASCNKRMPAVAGCNAGRICGSRL